MNILKFCKQTIKVGKEDNYKNMFGANITQTQDYF